MERFVFDEDYVRRLREGDPATWLHFHAYFQDRLYLKLRGRLSSTEAIDEVRQEVFARTFEHLAELRDPRTLGAFVAAICKNVLHEYYRSRNRTDRLDDQAEIADEHIDVEGRFEEEQRAQRVRRIMSQMDARDALVLRAILDGTNKAELCRRLGIERTYLRVVFHRAKEKFRALYLRRKSGRLQIFETFGRSTSLTI
jgi:RNA polymerase sigma-70 factor (ECF subfamily)